MSVLWILSDSGAGAAETIPEDVFDEEGDVSVGEEGGGVGVVGAVGAEDGEAGAAGAVGAVHKERHLRSAEGRGRERERELCKSKRSGWNMPQLYVLQYIS